MEKLHGRAFPGSPLQANRSYRSSYQPQLTQMQPLHLSAQQQGEGHQFIQCFQLGPLFLTNKLKQDEEGPVALVALLGGSEAREDMRKQRSSVRSPISLVLSPQGG